jgi:Flp pilus assembly pilin Flp
VLAERIPMQARSRIRRDLLRDTRGANMVEYIILVGVVALFCVAGFAAFSSDVKKTIIEYGGRVVGL